MSGGERNRLLLARLFAQPSNLLVLDEPTNDLDSETLELLEELLADFKGTLLLICHDRTFLNNVVTSSLVFSKNNKFEEFVGGYDDWVNEINIKQPEAKQSSKIDKKKIYKQAKKAKQKRKLSYKENIELESLPSQIETMEDQLEEIHKKMANPELYRNKDNVLEAKDQLEYLETKLAKAYKKWEYLESIESDV